MAAGPSGSNATPPLQSVAIRRQCRDSPSTVHSVRNIRATLIWGRIPNWGCLFRSPARVFEIETYAPALCKRRHRSLACRLVSMRRCGLRGYQSIGAIKWTASGYERPTGLQGAYRMFEGLPMTTSKADEFRKQAEECRKRAESAASSFEKQHWREVAEHWLKMAAAEEAATKGPVARV